jgi:hypothetical protein
MNVALGGALGVFGGAVAAFLFTNSTCKGASADSMCGLILFFLGPIWAVTDGIAGAFAGAVIIGPPRNSRGTLTGAVLGVLSAIAVAVMVSTRVMAYRSVVMSPEHLRQLERWVWSTVPLVIAAGGTLGGMTGNRLGTWTRRVTLQR